jgi:hypothetical protein
MCEIYADFKKDYDTVRSVVLLGASATLRRAFTVLLISVCLSVHKQ